MSPATTAASPGPWTKCSIKVLVHNFRRNMSAPAWRWLWHCMCQSRVIFRKWSLPVFISQGRILYTKIWKPSCGAVREFINTWFQSYIKSNVIAQYSMVILMSQRSWRRLPEWRWKKSYAHQCHHIIFSPMFNRWNCKVRRYIILRSR